MRSRSFWCSGARMLAGALFVASVCSAAVAQAAPAFTSPLGALAGNGRSSAGSVGIATDGIGDDVDTANLLDFNGQRTVTFAGVLRLGGDFPSREDDVHAAWFWAGEVVSISVAADAGTTAFTLSLFGPSTQSVYTDAPPWTETAYPLSISPFRAPVTGFYYIDIYTHTQSPSGGAGGYTLDVTIDRCITQMIIDPQAALAYGGTTDITGAVVNPYNPTETVTGDVLLSYSDNGRDFFPYMEDSTSDGTFSFDIDAQSRSYYYQVTYEGSMTFDTSAGNVFVGMRASLARPSASRYGTSSYTLSGMLHPSTPPAPTPCASTCGVPSAVTGRHTNTRTPRRRTPGATRSTR